VAFEFRKGMLGSGIYDDEAKRHLTINFKYVNRNFLLTPIKYEAKLLGVRRCTEADFASTKE
jgi:hypothetical protein